MNTKEELLSNIDRLHTTEMGAERIKENLKLDTNYVVDFCKKKVLDKNCVISRIGKNYGIDYVKEHNVSNILIPYL